jgi:DNA-directed RNA polymerase beta subunit
MSSAKIYINGELIGSCNDPEVFVDDMREKRRAGEISEEMNITYYNQTNEIYIFNDPGRARRPLIIVKDGVPLLEEKHINEIKEGKIKWDDLIAKGLVEYLDAEEEENSYISMGFHELNEDHTHLEIDPSTMLGICAGIIPFSDHNSSPRNTMEAGMTKQALGLYVSNYALRTDTRAHLLHHPQTPLVKTRIIDATNYDKRPSGQNFVVAVMSFEGYNMEDALILNKSSLERGLARSSFFRSYETFERKYPGGQEDKFEVPGKGVRGYRSEEVYKHLDEDGIVNPES